ncbi:MAG: type III-B CRISPR module RAMP protein Cmr6 [Saprospiraceae bacterium]
MEKGILKLSKSKKGKIIVALDRLNGKPPMPLSNVFLQSLEHNDKECMFEMVGGKITKIEIENILIHGGTAQVATSKSDTFERHQNATDGHRVYGFRDALDIQQSQLPKAIKDLGNFDIDNFSLKYNKAARYIDDAPGKNKFFFFKNDHRTYRDGRPPTGDEFFIQPNYGSLNFEDISKRHQNQVKSLFPENKSEVVKITPDWRLVCGLSGGIYETNMTLHHVYGVPYIPASSIKGVVRSWIITTVFGATAPDQEKNFPMVNAEYRALKGNKLFCELFGAPESIERVVFEGEKPKEKKDKYGKVLDEFIKEKEKSALGKEQQGNVVFFEGLPTIPPKLMPDVINVHYPDWYKAEGYSAPTDFQKTNPVIFLTVTDESQFQTAVGSKCGNQKINSWDGWEALATSVELNGDATIIELATKWLNLALSEHGIGAKTAVGYGYMKQVEE